MRIDWYTKGVLTVIAVLLAMVVFKQYVIPETVQAQSGSFAGVQYFGFPNSFFDPPTGDVWHHYDLKNPTHYRVARLGSPMIEVK